MNFIKILVFYFSVSLIRNFENVNVLNQTARELRGYQNQVGISDAIGYMLSVPGWTRVSPYIETLRTKKLIIIPEIVKRQVFFEMELFRDIRHSAIIFLLHFVRLNFISYFGEIRNIQFTTNITTYHNAISRKNLFIYTNQCSNSSINYCVRNDISDQILEVKQS